jgi:hypothetical protein
MRLSSHQKVACAQRDTFQHKRVASHQNFYSAGAKVDFCTLRFAKSTARLNM